MATSFQEPVNVFLSKIEKDIDFFKYFGLTEEEAAEIAAKRSRELLLQANSVITLRCKPRYEINFCDVNLENDSYNGDLNSMEIYIIGSIMYELYLQKDFAKIKLDNVNYTASELRVFDPSNARSSFTAIYNTICAENKVMLAQYEDTDRETGGYLGIDFASYEEE